jgi:hypothetical protein
MKMNIYSIYDQAAKAYLNPFFLHNDGLAIRAFQDNVNSTDDNNIAKHPDQFTLFKLASYDDQTGLIEALPSPTHLTGGLEVKNPTPESDILKEIKALKGYLKEKPILKEIVNS